MAIIEEKYQEFLRQMGDESFLEPYREACRETKRRLEKINTCYSKELGRTFISKITYRIKTPESCLNKMIMKKYRIERQTAQEKLNDISGIRVVCNFLDDIYKLVEILKEDKEWKVIKTKDYVRKPKASGYQSLHVIVLVPIKRKKEKSVAGDPQINSSPSEYIKAEIQIRTRAMNFWAVVEHHFVYKSGDYERCEVEKDLKECARAIYKIDKKMLVIRDKMGKC